VTTSSPRRSALPCPLISTRRRLTMLLLLPMTISAAPRSVSERAVMVLNF